MSNIAFLNDAAVKVAALQRARSDDSVGWKVEDTDEDRARCSDRFGLAPGLLNLLCHGFHVPYGQDAREKLHTALEAITPGADTLALVRDWTLSLWESPEFGVKSRLEGTPAAAAAAEVVRLIQTSATEEVPREAWRRARNALVAKRNDSADLDDVIELVAALGWDLDRSPRATTDIWNLWEASVVGPVNRAGGWPQDAQDTVYQAVRDAHTAVYTKLGTPPTDRQQALEFNQRVQDMVTAELTERGMQERFLALQQHIGTSLIPAMTAWRAIAERSVHEACRAARPTAPR